MIIVTGQVAALGHQNLTICPHAHSHTIRCSYIQMQHGPIIEGPLQMDETIYEALQSGRMMTIAIYPGGLFFRRSVQSVRFSHGDVVCNREAIFKRFFTLATSMSIVLYGLIYGYFSQLIDSESGFRAAGVGLILWVMLTSFAWLRLQRGRYWLRLRHRLSHFTHHFHE
ncbi:hypothetical protein [Celerinatantimonas sp. YJH-8]|uniref:hypothetical protein n=1 Tax=Celerinatantimonas sp. YJH-8 TaxID=3228714 RepID=UPI0038C72862